MFEIAKNFPGLNPQHVTALEWFEAHKGQTIPWSEIQAYAEHGARLVNQAKGIYKPQYADYALSVRQTLNSPYADQEIIWDYGDRTVFTDYLPARSSTFARACPASVDGRGGLQLPRRKRRSRVGGRSVPSGGAQ